MGDFHSWPNIPAFTDMEACHASALFTSHKPCQFPPAISVVPPSRDLHAVDGDGKTCLHHACSSKAGIAHAVVAAIVTGGPDMGQLPAHKMHHFYDLFAIYNLHIILILVGRIFKLLKIQCLKSFQLQKLRKDCLMYWDDWVKVCLCWPYRAEGQALFCAPPLCLTDGQCRVHLHTAWWGVRGQRSRICWRNGTSYNSTIWHRLTSWPYFKNSFSWYPSKRMFDKCLLDLAWDIYISQCWDVHL